MSVNLLKNVQEALQYPPLQKMDPNTQQMAIHTNSPDEDKFSQAAIPAVLAGLYKYAQTDDGAAAILKNELTETWLSRIFNKHRKEVLEAVSSYSQQSAHDPVSKMEMIAVVSVAQVLHNLPAKANMKDVKDFLSHQISTILLYLPPALNIGVFLNDNVMDDQTNKMEGPFSSIMQNVGSFFSKPATGTDEHIY